MYRSGMATMERPPEPDGLAEDDDIADGDDGRAGAAEPPDVLGDLGIKAGLVSPAPAWPGVLLTPEAIASYEELVPGAAERILKLAEQAARSEAQIWTEDEGGWAGFMMFVAVVFFGLAVGGVGTTAALIAGGCLTGVAAVILLCGWLRWATVRRRPGGPGN
jgi:hypothetical protein